MPKRKHEKSDEDRIRKKIKKLERKLTKYRRREKSRSRSASSSKESLQILENQIGQVPFDRRSSTSSPVSEPALSEIMSHNDNESRQALRSEPQPSEVPGPMNDTAAAGAGDAEKQIPAIESLIQDQPLNSEFLDILGEDPSCTEQYGKCIHKDLVNRLQHILCNGLDKDTRKELLSKYLIPENCKIIGSPMLNPEVKAALTSKNKNEKSQDITLKRDKGLASRQKQVSSVISCLAEAISYILNEKDNLCINTILRYLMDAVRILCDSQHDDSTKRRYFISSTLKKDINEHLLQTKIDSYLFGENLAEILKSAKAISKSGAEIKVNYTTNIKQMSFQPQPSTSRGLNSKAGSAPRRRPGPGWRTQPAYYPQQHPRYQPPPPPPLAARRQPDTSSRPSRPPPRQAYRH